MLIIGKFKMEQKRNMHLSILISYDLCSDFLERKEFGANGVNITRKKTIFASI